MKYIKQTLLLFILCLTSCNHTPNMDLLDDVDTYIEERPDSALTVLNEIDKSTLSSKEERAKYALLLSMTLDKNYIDTTSFEVIQPAIDYYQKHGSEFDRMRTLYYQGRIYANKRDYASASSCYFKALNSGNGSDYINMRARIHVACGVAYERMKQLEKSAQSYTKAAEYYNTINNKNAQFKCYNRMLTAYTRLMDKEKGSSTIAKCEKLADSVDFKKRIEFYNNRLYFYATTSSSPNKTKKILDDYFLCVPDSLYDYLNISLMYYVMNEYEKALVAINKNKTNGNEIECNLTKALINEKLGNKAEALSYYHKYMIEKDSISTIANNHKVLLVEKAHDIEIQKMKELAKRDRYISILSVFLVLLILVLVWIRYKLKLNAAKSRLLEEEAERLRLQYFQLEKEYDELRSISRNGKIDNNVRKALDERIGLLNRFMSSHILNNNEFDRKIEKEINDIVANKEEFMNNTRLSFAGSHPEFISHLKEHGLSDTEINYCCLYAIGLKGKDIGVYINMKSHYNMSSTIREKLGISEHDTNLGLYIKKLLNGQP